MDDDSAQRDALLAALSAARPAPAGHGFQFDADVDAPAAPAGAVTESLPALLPNAQPAPDDRR